MELRAAAARLTSGESSLKVMALEIRQSLKLAQTLIMTQKLQQAIKLLQLSRLELVGEINQALEANPVLEESSYEEPEQEEERREPEVLSFSHNGDPPLGQGEEHPPEADSRSAVEEWDWDGFLRDRLMVPPLGEFEEKEAFPFENLNAQKTTLKSHLMFQLRMADLSETAVAIGELLIGNLDRDGYLQTTVEEIAAEAGVAPARVEEVLRTIQGFDPPGVAARDLKECLKLQLQALGVTDPLVFAIVRDHLLNLANKNYLAIARDLKVSPEKVAQAAQLISSLEPKPGRGFDTEEPAYIQPDIHVEKVGDDYVIRLNDDGLPRLRVNPYYLEAMRGPEKLPDAVKNYIQKHLDNALWFIRSIHQRQKTMYRVAESIVRFQREFLDQGLSHLRPLTLRQVAEDVQMHESTISRVTTNKYIHTPQGVFDLKFFFNSGINLSLGDQIASESVKEKIRQIVMSEDAEKPLSDQEIADILHRQDVLIARRTVAKYRGMLGVLSSSKRKKPSYRRKNLSDASAS